MDVGVVLAAIGGAAATGQLLVEITKSAYRSLKARQELIEDIDYAKELLGVNCNTDVAYRHDSVHPLYSTQAELHPDNLAALRAVAGNDFYRAATTGHLRAVDTVTSALNTNLVLIGSPTAEGLSRPVFGYEPDIDQDSLALQHPPIDLPFRWELSRANLTSKVQARRRVENKGDVLRPNWQLIGPKRVFTPVTSIGDWLETDFLLVTRMRNYLSTEALDEGKYIVSFGGTHGTATRAVEVLLRDRGVLKEIAVHLRGRPAAYQLILQVGGMNHDQLSGTRATKVELVGDPVILPDEQYMWRQAATIAKTNLDKWMSREISPRRN